MSWRVSGKIARRELRSGLGGFRILIACLALGVAAIAAVGTVRSGIQAGLVSEGAALLGGDAEAEFTYRFATEVERTWMEDRADAISQFATFHLKILEEPDYEKAYVWLSISAALGVEGAFQARNDVRDSLDDEKLVDLQSQARTIYESLNISFD